MEYSRYVKIQHGLSVFFGLSETESGVVPSHRDSAILWVET